MTSKKKSSVSEQSGKNVVKKDPEIGEQDLEERSAGFSKTFEGSAILRTEDLVKRYKKRTVVDNVTVDVRQGEIVGLLGPNGAGKTTTFYMVVGMVRPNAGHVFMDNTEITTYPMYQRARLGIGYLPQEASVFRRLTVRNNILAVLQLTKLSKI